MSFNVVNYNTLFCNIQKDLDIFCYKYNFEFDNLKIKTKREILIRFSLENILKYLEKTNHKNPIFFYEKEFNNSLFLFCFKKLEKILCFPFIYCECFDCSKGTSRELSKKAEIFHLKNQYSHKTVKKELNGENYFDLIQKIIDFKSLGCFRKMESIFEL
jgi:hypothetical protein